MFCLLCHEKISRLRAWRTKSEFCCDEHAEIYKRQTLERLLTDHENPKPVEAPPLPVDTTPRDVVASAPAGETPRASETLARFDEDDASAVLEQRLEPRAELEPFERSGRDEGLRDEGLQELWRLAEEVSPASAEGDDDGWASATARLSDPSADSSRGGFGDLGGGLGSSLGSLGKGLGSDSGSIRDQTPEEALAALRELSGGARRSAARQDEPDDEIDSLLSARAFDAASEKGLGLSAAGRDLPVSLDDALAGEELPPLDAASLEPLDDDELPSILERLTEHPAATEGFDLAATPPAQEFAEELQPSAPVAEEIPAELEQPVSEAADHEDEAASAEVAAAETVSEDLGAFDLLEAAVESHLEESEEPSSQRASSPKVVPFPLSRPKAVFRDESEEPLPAASQSAASASGEGPRPAKSGKGPNAAKGPNAGKRMPGDLSRLQLKPVAVMYGLEPALFEPAPDATDWPPAAWGTRPELDGIAEPPISYPNAGSPDAGGGRRAGAHLPLHARLFPLLPEAPALQPMPGEAGQADWPDYTLPCETPLPLAWRRNGKSRRPSVGSERAWMFRIEPALAEGSEFELQLPNGKRHAPWKTPQLPPALVSAVTPQNGSGKLDLSGPQGRFEPPVDRLCQVFPQLGELGAGIPRQTSSRAPGEELGRWVPPTVLDPRFDIERPAGRDLSDFG